MKSTWLPSSLLVLAHLSVSITLGVQVSEPNAATLPEHPPLRILIVSDEVNPHSLPDADLTQPGEISTAIESAASGINIDAGTNAVFEVATDDLPMATAALDLPPSDPLAYDVLIYFAHRIPNGAGGASAQADFVDAMEDFLMDGGGVVSFHHGSYLTAGKESVMSLIGATASDAVFWDTNAGQNIINVAPGHFVTSHAVSYPGMLSYSAPSLNVPADVYVAFNNTPDERYPTFATNPDAGDFNVLLASDYNQSGDEHLIGFTHRQPTWEGLVVGYQPGEYQPNALNDLDGANFQIFANAILWAANIPDLVPLFADSFETTAR